MNDQYWSNYMKKYKNRFFITRDECGLSVLEFKQGKIAPYDLENGFLGVWCTDLTPRKKSSLLRRLNPYLVDVHQDADSEFGAYFVENNFYNVCKILNVRRRRELSPQQRLELSDRARKNFGHQEIYCYE